VSRLATEIKSKESMGFNAVFELLLRSDRKETLGQVPDDDVTSSYIQLSTFVARLVVITSAYIME
jgi:hypothetical protein